MTKAPVNEREMKRSRNGGTRIIVARGENIRTFRLNPWVFGSGAGILLLFLTAYVGATAYLIFRDDLLTAAMTRQVEIQYDYEDRISLLRSEIDRVTSRHIVETESIEDQVASLVQRQSGLRRQQVLLDDLIGRARQQGVIFASVVTPTPSPRPELHSDAEDDSMAFSPETESPAAAATEGAVKSTPAKPSAQLQPKESTLNALHASLTRFEQRQALTVHALKVLSAREAKRLAVAMRQFGLRPPPPPSGMLDSSSDSAQGGPFIPADTSSLLNGMVTIQHTLQHIDLLKNSSSTIPVTKPLPRIQLTSTYGYRVDPFLKKPGFHPGIDLRAPKGTPVSAAGAGRVSYAATKGGYGLLVELSHGNGLKTRYAHLSAINVTPGQIVNSGDIIGLVGSTGRSTGPHLHYEAERKGKTVDPMSFLNADND